jgi:hypothetical protein
MLNAHSPCFPWGYKLDFFKLQQNPQDALLVPDFPKSGLPLRSVSNGRMGHSTSSRIGVNNPMKWGYGMVYAFSH